MNPSISKSILNLFDNYNDYLLSKNICLILKKEYNTDNIQPKSLILITNIVSKYIETLSHQIKNCTELAGREEPNIIDVLFALLLKSNKKQSDIYLYMEKKNPEKNLEFNINMTKILSNEENKRKNYLEELNCINVPKSNCINKTLLNMIPKNLRYFPREFTLKSSDNILDKNDKYNKEKNEIKKLEKKNLEDIISGNEYYDVNNKNKGVKGYINVLNIYDDIVKELNQYNDSNEIKINSELFGQQFFEGNLQEEHKDNENDIKGLNNMIIDN